MAPRDPVLEPLTYTVPQAAQVLNVSPTHLRNLIKAGEIVPVPGLGRRILIGRAYLEQWVRDRVTSALQESDPKEHHD